MAKTARVAVDIGGTFTDLVSIDERGRLRRAKSESTPAALEEAVLTVLGHSGVEPAEVGTFIHGSTVVINAITERRGARTALVTTRGFRDVLEITRANRPDLYNLRYQKPVPFVERSHRLEVTERVPTGATRSRHSTSRSWPTWSPPWPSSTSRPRRWRFCIRG